MVLTILRIADSDLYHSEPPPHLFGNPRNDKQAGWTNENWLRSRFHFSFAEYRNPKNTQFGCLRVMNDDLVQGPRGFWMHPHVRRPVSISRRVISRRVISRCGAHKFGTHARSGTSRLSLTSCTAS